MRAALASLLLASTPAAADPVLVFPKPNGAARLELSVRVSDRPPDEAWSKFLDALFDHFDRDGNGSLDATEAARVFPLPLADGREAAMDFQKLDANHDDKASKAEFRAYYRAAGFTREVVQVRPAAAATVALGDAVFRHLDRDGDGQLSVAELRDAPSLLNRFDEDEDEALTPAELLAGFKPPAKRSAETRLFVLGESSAPPAKLTLPLSGPPILTDAPDFTLSADGKLLTTPSGVCSISHSAAATDLRATTGFYLAQFKHAGDKPTAKAVFENDPTTQVLAGLFDAADRDGDGKLTRTELVAFFALIEKGVGSRVVVMLEDRGRNLFDVLDTNADGRLDGSELRRLAKEKPLARDAVPASYRMTVARGSVGNTFGPLPLGTPAPPKAQMLTKAAAGPRWFRAMDRNGDGFVSAAEFLGPPTRFQTLDADGDGRISVAEANAAGG